MPVKKSITLFDAQKESAPVAFSSMLKPAGSTCNLDCQYCYYLDKAALYGGRQAVMSDELLEMYVKQYVEANQVDTIQFLWHGGEPMLLGIDYYRRALELEQKYADGKRIENVFQTNGTLVDDEWCELFAANNFLLGISIDGPEDIHDRFRVDKGGKPTFERVMRGVELLKKHRVEFNTMSVVNKLSEGRGAEVYRFMKSIGSHYMQFMPAVEHVVDKEGYHRPMIVSPETQGARMAPWSVSAKGYGEFLNDIFDRWVVSDVGQYFVQMFDATLACLCGVRPGVCTMGETCGDCLVVEHNGDVYNCDHFVYPEHLLGNIRQQTLSEIYASPKRFAFGIDKREQLPRECRRCKYFRICHGECPKHRFETTASGEPYHNSLCEGLKAYFAHTEPYMIYMRQLLEQQQSPSFVIPFARQRMGLM